MKRLLFALVLTSLLGVSCTRPPPVPQVATTGLDRTAADLIQRHVEAVRAAPRSGDAWGELGAVLKSYAFADEAEFCLLQAKRMDKKNARWPYFLASLGNEPLPNLRQAVALCGNEPEMPRLRLARLLAESGRQNEARAELQQLLRAKPNSASARLMHAQLALAEGDLNQAIASAKICATNSYTARSAWILLAFLYQRQGDTNGADLASRRAAAVAADAPWPDPFEEEVLALRNDARSLSDRAQGYLMAGRAAEAMPIVQQLVREHPDFAETWLLLGRAQYLLKQPAAAEQSLRRFLQADPNSVNGHFQLGMSLLALRRFNEAAETFRQATTLKDDFGPAFFNLGFALAKSGQPQAAVAAFQEAIRQNPEMIDAYVLLADLHVQLGQSAEALQLTRLAERLNPSDPRLPALRQKIP